MPSPFRPPARIRFTTYVRWQPDKWERLHVLAALVADATRVLDVGGRSRELASLLPRAEVVSANVRPPADVVCNGARLPFRDRAFDTVTSSDVLEHVPRSERDRHVEELARVARERIVIGCPLGTPEHEASERRIAARLRVRYGLRLDFLEEHLEHGLPSEAELRATLSRVAPPSATELWYHSDFLDGEQMLLDGVAARWGHDPRALIRLLRRSYLSPRSTELTNRRSPTTNRVYAVVHLAAAASGGDGAERAS